MKKLRFEADSNTIQVSIHVKKKEHLESIKPVMELITTAAGRSLKVKEVRLLEAMHEKQISVFESMLNDILGASAKQQVPFGYGYFDD